MQFQRSTDYAIRILHYLNSHEPLSTASTIAEAIGISYPKFIEIATQLRKHGMLSSEQGRNGGYRLAKSASKISLYDVFLAIEGEATASHCLEDEEQCGWSRGPNCAIRAYFRQTQEATVRWLSGRYIADLDKLTP